MARTTIERDRTGIRKDAKLLDCRSIAHLRIWSAMNRRPDLPQTLISVDLAREPDFAVGRLEVCPSRREANGDGVRETVQPRVMQVLVALFRAKGAVVSREDLIESCWDGIVVGDDAINRCIAKVRQISELGEGRHFEIETIPRVGYRLHAPTAWAAPASTSQVQEPALNGERVGFATVLAQGKWVFASLALVAVLAFALLPLLRPSQAPQWIIAETHLPLIATPLIERYPAISPDGTMIAYSAGADYLDRQIYVRRIAGGEPFRLTNEKRNAVFPAWSPDGTQIAYLTTGSSMEPCGIMLVPVPSGLSREVGSCKSALRSSLAWDHSGRGLYFADSPSRNQPIRIMRLDLESGRVGNVTDPGDRSVVEEWSPTASPDGKTLAYFRDRQNGNRELVLHTFQDRRDRVALCCNDAYASAAWMSDSQNLFIVRQNGNDSSLWVYDATGAALPQRITASPVILGRVSSGPGGLVAMELNVVDTELVQGVASFEKEPTQLDKTDLQVAALDYASDGTFAAAAATSVNCGIWIKEPRGEFRELLRLQSYCAERLRWSPGGDRLAFALWDNGKYVLRVISRRGAPLASIPLPSTEIGYLEWDASGGSLMVSWKDPQGIRVWRVDPAHPETRTALSSYGWQRLRSAGGALIGMRSDAPGLWRLDAVPRRLTDWPLQNWASLWTTAGDRVIYADYSDEKHPKFMARAIDGSKAPVMLSAIKDIEGHADIALNPASGAVVYVYRKRDDTDIGLLRIVRK